MEMKLKFSPILYNENSFACASCLPDTQIIVKDENTLSIDTEDYEFDPLDVSWPSIATDTGGVILEAHREGGVLYATIRRFYTSDWQSWYSPDYVEVKS